jgi:hypothetical protein
MVRFDNSGASLLFNALLFFDSACRLGFEHFEIRQMFDNLGLVFESIEFSPFIK